jgi:hypothetical protein
MFSETHYALNGDLRVAYRTSAKGPRDILFVANWFTHCEVAPELPSMQGWTCGLVHEHRAIGAVSERLKRNVVGCHRYSNDFCQLAWSIAL